MKRLMSMSAGRGQMLAPGLTGAVTDGSALAARNPTRRGAVNKVCVGQISPAGVVDGEMSGQQSVSEWLQCLLLSRQ